MLHILLQLRNKWHIKDVHQVVCKLVYFSERRWGEVI